MIMITSEKYNMRINMKKTKIMRMSTVEGRTMKITVNGQNLKRVKQFCYLGSLVTEDCRSCHDVRKRIALGKEAFKKKVTSCEDPSAFTWRNVWWKHLFGVLRCMKAKRELYKKKIFGHLRHLKYGFGGVWWKYHWLSTKQINRYCRWLSVETEREIMDTVRSLQRW